MNLDNIKNFDRTFGDGELFLAKKVKSLSVWHSGNINMFYVFILDYFILAFQAGNGVKLYNEAELKETFDKHFQKM